MKIKTKNKKELNKKVVALKESVVKFNALYNELREMGLRIIVDEHSSANSKTDIITISIRQEV